MDEIKKAIKNEFKTFLRNYIYSFRKQYKLTQEKMAEVLHITPRCYFEQEHGKYSFSAVSFAFFILAMDEEERSEFLDQLSCLFNESKETIT